MKKYLYTLLIFSLLGLNYANATISVGSNKVDSGLKGSNEGAYSIVNVTNNTAKYEQIFLQKINLSGYDTSILKSLNTKIVTYITKTEDNTTLSDTKKEELLGQLIALTNIVSSELTNREQSSNIIVTVIGDNRCTDCMTTDYLLDQLKQLSYLHDSKFVVEDFSGTGVADYLKDNGISYLPAVIFSTGELNDNGSMTDYLQQLPDNQYSLDIGASFNPFLTRSDKGLLVLDQTTLDSIKSNTYLKGDKDAKISWLEYSDLECPYCAKLNNSDVESSIDETYSGSVNKYFSNFPLSFHENAFTGSLVLECLGEQKGSDAFYSLIDDAYKDGESDEDYLVEKSVELGADKQELEDCISSQKYADKISNQESSGSTIFGIDGTPASVLVNNDTLEYIVIIGAYPFEKFKEAIDELLK